MYNSSRQQTARTLNCMECAE